MTDPTPTGAPPPPPGEPARRLQPRERSMLILLGAVGALALIVLLVTMVLGGDGDEEVAGPRPPAPVTEPTLSPTPTPPPRTDGVFTGRDPFEPPIKAPPVVAPPDANGTPPPSPPPEDTTDEGVTVSLLDIFTTEGTRRATIAVDTDEFTVAEGETFADSFRLDRLTDECAEISFGDEGFRLCIGEEARK